MSYCSIEMSGNMPKGFLDAVSFGSLSAVAPSGFGDNKSYVSCWKNRWLAERLYNQYRYLRAKTNGRRAAQKWFLPINDKQSPADWKTTAMHIMNAEYAGNASYEWFEWREDENGERQMYRVNQFDRIENTDDKRLDNPALDYIFSHPELSVCTAFREFKSSEKKN